MYYPPATSSARPGPANRKTPERSEETGVGTDQQNQDASHDMEQFEVGNSLRNEASESEEEDEAPRRSRHGEGKKRLFVNSYYAVSSTIRSRFTIAFCGASQAKVNDWRLIVFSSSYEDEKSSSLATTFHMTIPSVYLSNASSCQSVHGLIGCTSSGPFFVCNPNTNNFTILPCAGARTSWGYDPVGDQFKALTMVSYPHQPHDSLLYEVLTLGGGESSWTRNTFTSPPHFTVTNSKCINGFVYYAAWTPTRTKNPVIVCFDVRYERLSFVKAPMAVVCWEGESILIEYKGKLASIARHPHADFRRFDLWILEDATTHDWSQQTFELPFSLGMGRNITSPGTNKAGEIIFAPKRLSYDVQPYYIFYYNGPVLFYVASDSSGD
ncbi:PREDICTED: F-box protein At1g30790-like [Camelina sativa]|uniref:F-box protein At1g30790-like n=1 Tax=Camelina sativa TaxID=90675 RepID=A0ABM0VYD8_CAMSA|nr:PREDICTED: F-box protein At1g30790-like [Camelina sativa]